MVWSVLAAGVLCPCAVGAGETDLCNVGSERQLFIDRAFFDQTSNIGLRLHPGKKTGEKVLQQR